MRRLVAALVALGLGPTAGAVAQTVVDDVTFTRDVLPVLQQNCQICHRPGQIGPMPLLTYEEARPWARAIKAQVIQRTMPPWHADPDHGTFLNDRSLAQTEIDTIAAWVDAGAPQGNPADAPPRVEWPEGGWLVEPDIVVDLPEYAVQADGVIEWETLALPSPFEEDTWVTSVEILPSEPSVVHHMCFDFQRHREEVVYNRYEWTEIPRDEEQTESHGEAADAQGRTGRRIEEDRWVLTRRVGSTEIERRRGRPSVAANGTHCYVPGLSLHDYRPLGAGQLVRAGTDMIFNLHYQTTGTAKVDNMKVGFTLAKEPPVKKVVQLPATVALPGFAIPPHESNYVAPSLEVEMRQPAELVWMSPHMHYRGKDMTWTLTRPDGTREILLSVPRYTYTWQLQYQTRVPVPPGSKIRIDAHYDNSSANRDNPNPNTWVYPGDQAWEEMMVGFTWVVVDTEVDERELVGRWTRVEGGGD